MNREVRKELKEAIKNMSEQLIASEKKRQTLINHKTDFAMLEEYIQAVNTNPGLIIEFTTLDGTKVTLRTSKERFKTYTEKLGEIDG